MTKKNVYVLLAVLLVALAVFIFRPQRSLAPTQNNNPVVVPAALAPAAGDITLGIGEAGQVGDLSIIWSEPLQDSRCPTSVQCIWAGEVRVTVTLKDALGTKTTSMILGKEPQSFDSHLVSITSVIPHPTVPGKILAKDYKVTFHVSLGGATQ
jgi:hypothetical protein